MSGADRPGRRASVRALVLAGLVISLVLAGVVSIYASARPDGLEFVAHELGFDTTAREHASGGSPLADYGVEGVEDPRLSSGLAGIIGVVLVGAIAFGLMHLLRRGRSGGGGGRGTGRGDPGPGER